MRGSNFQFLNKVKNKNILPVIPSGRNDNSSVMPSEVEASLECCLRDSSFTRRSIGEGGRSRTRSE